MGWTCFHKGTNKFINRLYNKMEMRWVNSTNGRSHFYKIYQNYLLEDVLSEELTKIKLCWLIHRTTPSSVAEGCGQG